MFLPTVKIVDPRTKRGWRIINESDFVEGEHELYVEPGTEPPPESAPAPAAAASEAEAKPATQRIEVPVTTLTAATDAGGAAPPPGEAAPQDPAPKGKK